MDARHRRKKGIEPPPRWQHPALTPDSPLLRTAAERARQLGETNGWSRSTIRCAMELAVPGRLARGHHDPVNASLTRFFGLRGR